MSHRNVSQLSSLLEEYNSVSREFLSKTAGLWRQALGLVGTAAGILGIREYYKRKADKALREEQARRQRMRDTAALLAAGAALGYFGPKLIRSKGFSALKPDYDRIYGGQNYDPLSEQ